MSAVERDVFRVLARQHRVRLRPGGNQDRARRQHDLLAGMLVRLRPVSADLGRRVPGHFQRRRVPEGIDLDLDRGQHLGKADAFLHRLRDFLVIERVARRVDQAATIGDRHAAPGIDQLGETGARPSREAASRSARNARACVMNSSAVSRSMLFHCSRTASTPRSATSAS